MPYEIHWEPDGLCVRFADTVTADEIVRIYEAISGDARSDAMHFVLTVFLGAHRSADMTLTDVKSFTALEKGASYGASWPVWRAAVATDASICDFLKYFMIVRTSRDPFEIFSTEAEATEWLNTNPRLRHKRVAAHEGAAVEVNTDKLPR